MAEAEGAAAVAAAGDAAVVDLPFLGAGVSYRSAWRWDVIRHREELDAIEFIPDDVAGPAGLRELLHLRDALPVLLHGIGLSLGSAEGLDPERLAHVARVAEAVRPTRPRPPAAGSQGKVFRLRIAGRETSASLST